MRYIPTEEDQDLIHEVKDKFWEDLGKLIAQHVAKVPVKLEDALLAQMSDMSSVYGSGFDKYLPQARKDLEKESL